MSQIVAVVPEPDDDIERLLDMREIADRLRLKSDTVRAMIARGEFPEPIRFGKLVRWRVATFNAWVAAREVKRRARR